MIIVSGRIYVAPENRDLFINKSIAAIKTARKLKGCLDFVVAADPIEQNRVNVYEEWVSEDELNEFRGSGPDSDINSLILSADVSQHIVENE